MAGRNAIILAAGTSSRFVPLNYERPKGLLDVKGEILVERQIRQLKEAGIDDITIVVGYMAESFSYLRDKFGLSIVENNDYNQYNNTSSIIRVLDKLDDTYICCSDNYFSRNVFMGDPSESYYSALYAEGDTDEYCLKTDANHYIKSVSVGGKDSWYMVGHAYFSHSFSERFSRIMENEYQTPSTKHEYWEDVYIRHIDELPMKMNKYGTGDIFEFDTLDELRLFDASYISDTRSSLLKAICRQNGWRERELTGFRKITATGKSPQFTFFYGGDQYLYDARLEEKVRKL